MWWRVKKWKLITSVEIRADSSPPEEYTIETEQLFDVTDQTSTSIGNRDINNEKDLVCAKSGGLNGGDHVWAVDGGGLEENAFVDSYLQIGPDFELFIDIDDGIGAWSKGQGAKLGKITVTISGANVLFDADIFLLFNSAEPEPPLYEIIGIDGTLEAVEYWPYDPGDGLGPIYDATTGAQLRASPQ